jgi:hypothetical protein
MLGARSRSHLLLQVRGDLLAVEAPVFDEDFVSPGTGHNHASHIDSWDIAFERLGIANRTALLG